MIQMSGVNRVRRVTEINLDIHMTAQERNDIWREAPGTGRSAARTARLQLLERRLNGDSRSDGLYAEKRETLAWPTRISA